MQAAALDAPKLALCDQDRLDDIIVPDCEMLEAAAAPMANSEDALLVELVVHVRIWTSVILVQSVVHLTGTAPHHHAQAKHDAMAEAEASTHIQQALS